MVGKDDSGLPNLCRFSIVVSPMPASVRTAIAVAFLVFSSLPLFPQSSGRFLAGTGSGIWSDIDETTVTKTISASGQNIPHRDIVPQSYRTLHLNKSALKTLLASVPPETSGPITNTGVELSVPMPGGGFHRFVIQESPIMEPGLAARFPELKTYVGQDLDDPSATMRMDLTPRGVHAIILSANAQVYLDPYSRETDTDYIAYYKRDFAPENKSFSCLIEANPVSQKPLALLPAGSSTGASLRIFRLAVACTGEYAAAVCSPNAPTVASTLAAIITSVNRCSAIYEREVAVRFVLVNGNDKLVYLDPSTDPYTSSSLSMMLGQNQTNIDSVIGSDNYDLGHVFGASGGGIATLGVVCVAGEKARGASGSSNPVGDPYDVDYVVHEIGHQFNANHPFDGSSGGCSGNANYSTAYEPGSGSTLMAYAGVCSPQNLAFHSDDYFHSNSYSEISSFVAYTSCPQIIATGNTPPTVGQLNSFTIPAQTPFALTASATDPEGDTLTYCWEEFDKGPLQDPTVDPRDNGSSPLFRSFPPTTNPTRIFPSLTYILNNQNVPPATIGPYASGEFLPTTSRTMAFRVTVRDNHPGGGGTSYASTTVTSVSTAGPFAVTYPNSAATIAGGSQVTVTWNVASTDVAPINCANVKISLSTDGGNTFPIVLASSVPNNGSASVTIPNTANVATTQGRIKIEAIGNVFFDISDQNLTFTSTNTAPVLNISGGIFVVKGTPTPTVATVATASDAEGDPVSVSVSNLPFGVQVTPSISNGSISLSVTADCSVVTTLSSRSYPIILTATDAKGSTTSATVNVTIKPNLAPAVGVYPDINVSAGSNAGSTPQSSASDGNGNLLSAPYSVTPATLPGGGAISINQATGTVTATTTSSTTLGTTSVRVTVLDSCGAAAVRTFNVNVVPAPSSPAITSSPPPSQVIVGSPYSFTFSASGNPSPSFSLQSGTLPPGLTLSTAGVLSGTAGSVGACNYSNIVVAANNGYQPAAQQTFSLWMVTRADNYLSSFGLSGGNAGWLFDYDGDGITNLMEYALQLDPTKASLSGLPAVVIKNYNGTNYLSITFTRWSPATDITYIVEGSSDLSAWSQLASSVAGSPASGAGFVRETGSAPSVAVEVRDTVALTSVSGQKRFLRLRVSSP